jgi:hypothetical protein
VSSYTQTNSLFQKTKEKKMSTKRFSQTKMHYIFIFLLAVVLLGATACGAAEPPPALEPAGQEVVVDEREVAAEEPMEAAADAPAAEQKVASEAESSASESSVNPVSDRPNVYNRLIIKNAEVELLVEDTDITINRSLGIVTEYSGYVVSNRTWIQGELKYATLTIGVPSEYFEEMLRRLKDLALSVTNETVSGQDVTDEFVDLKSRLTNLEATAARIRSFLEQAQDVEESLRVNAQLAEIEAEIEQVKGRMAFLKDRAAFSTITLQITPKVPESPTPTPTPTPTPEPWSAGRTFNNATTVTSSAARTIFQVTVDLAIWGVVVILPFILPIVALVWLGVWLVRRMGVGQTVRPPSS